MITATRVLRNTIRRFGGRDHPLEVSGRHAVNRVRWALRHEFRRRDVHVFRSAYEDAERLGVFAYGSCDLWSVVHVGRLLARGFGATDCILKVGNAASARSDVILQTLDERIAPAAESILQRFGLSRDYFRPTLFQPTFTVPDHAHVGRFPKDVVVLSIAADLTRIVYQHRDSGVLVDPGGWWLAQSLDRIRARLGDTKWFARNFRKLGRIDVFTFRQNMRRLIEEVRLRTGAQVLVFNTLVTEPGRPTPDYRLVADPHDRRRREFNVALAELTAEVDFSIIDVDRVLKGVGTVAQADFIHYAPQQTRAVAEEVVRVLHARGVLSTGRIASASTS